MTKTLSQEEQKYKRKYEELYKKLQDLEENNRNLDLKIIKTRKCIKRLKVEKSFLFEKLDKIKKTTDFDSDDSEIENNPPPQAVKVEEKHQKKKQKNIDPLAPKKPANAFFRFCQVQRKDLKSQIKSEDSSNSDITKLLSNLWKELPQEDKQQYYDMYEKDKARYEKELEAYNTNSEHKKGASSPISKGKIKGRTKGKGSVSSTSKIRMNSISTTDDNVDDAMNSVNDNQTENSFNNTTNNDDDNDDDMQVDDNEDDVKPIDDDGADAKKKSSPDKQGDDHATTNDDNHHSRSTSVEYSGETAQSAVDSNLDDTNINDNDDDDDNDDGDNDDEDDDDNDDDDNDDHTNNKANRKVKKFSIDSQDEIEESQDEVDSNFVDDKEDEEEEDEEVVEEEDDDDQATNDDETEGMDEDTQLDEEEDDDDDNKDE